MIPVITKCRLIWCHLYQSHYLSLHFGWMIDEINSLVTVFFISQFKVKNDITSIFWVISVDNLFNILASVQMIIWANIRLTLDTFAVCYHPYSPEPSGYEPSVAPEPSVVPEPPVALNLHLLCAFSCSEPSVALNIQLIWTFSCAEPSFALNLHILWTFICLQLLWTFKGLCIKNQSLYIINAIVKIT